MQEEIQETIIDNQKERLKADYNKLNYSSYCFVRLSKKYPNLTRKQINKIITLYFKECREEIELGQRVNLPNRLGGFYATKKKHEVYYDEEENKVVNNLPINFKATMDFWKEHPERKGITYIRYMNQHSNQYCFRLRFNLKKALFKNKNIYGMNFNSRLKKNFSENIIEKKVDAYIEKDYKNNNYE